MTVETYTDPMTQEVWVIIDRGNGEFTSMPKPVYDAQVEHLTEIPTLPAE